MNQNFRNLSSTSSDLKDLIETYTKHWKWFFLSVLVALTLAFLKIRYSIPEYATQAQIQIVQDKNASTGLSVFGDLDIFGGGSSKVEDEIQILTSRSSLIEVVKELRLNIKVISMGNIISSEQYENPPFKVNFIATDSLLHNVEYEFFIELSTDTTFGFSEQQEVPKKIYSFGKNIPSPVGEIVITPNVVHPGKYSEGRYKVLVSPVADIAQMLKGNIFVTPSEEYSNILNITLENPIPAKAIDILNKLVEIYNRNDLEDRKMIADRTSQFINDRISDIYTDLSTVDQSAQDFKTGRGLTDMVSEASLNMNIGAATQQDLQNVTTQLNIASSMKDIVENEDDFELLPSNVGLSDASITSTTSQYNQLVLERKRLLKSSNEKNPIIVNLDQQLLGLKRNMQSSLGSMTNNLGMQVNNLSQRQSQINSKIYSTPRNERALRDITRQQQTTESLYLYLLQKREESQIAFASAASKSKIIDGAYKLGKFPVSPKKKITYLIAFILGLLLPFSIIYANDILDTKVHSMHMLEKYIKDVPVLGELPKLTKKDQKLVIKEDRSTLGEALRILRTNLDYLIKTKITETGKSNVVYVTSSVPGEGKTFISTNMAMILASANKKVLLIGADIRNPKLYAFFTGDEIDKMSRSSKNKDAGLTEYLYDNSLQVNDIINPMLVYQNTIDVIYSGRIPPNPAELLMSSRVKDLITKVSGMYDYVIVDTAPLMVVSDTLLISEYADHIIYVTRAGVTDTKALEFPLKLQEEGKIKGLAFVVNDVKTSNLGYGGQYGYGYGKTLKKWWKF